MPIAGQTPAVLDVAELTSRIGLLGFSERDARTLAEHFLDAERRGKRGHGLIRAERLHEHDFDPRARPRRTVAEPCFERWESAGAVGYLVLAAICDAQLASPPDHARLVVASPCFPTGVLGYWTRRLAAGGLAAALTATSPRRLGHPEGGPHLTGTNPISIAVPSSDGRPVVTDVSMGQVTFGDVLAGAATDDDLVPFGGEQAHKSFALAVGLQLLVDALTGGEAFGAVLLVARPEGDPVPGLRALANGARLPGDQ
jgi:LDH2 family malate/lactate/ureidoglycolate dehydrogenase